MVAGHESSGAARGRAGLALLDDHGPSAVIACLNAIRVNDPAAVAAAVPPAVPVEDYRADSNHRFHDGRTLVETLARWGTELAFDLSLLAYRGDAHALVRVNLPLQDGLLGCLVLATCSADQVQELAVYDLDDLGVAMRELGHRWAAELPRDQAEVVGVCADLLWSAVGGDFETMRTILADDLASTDHRSSAQPSLGPAADMIESIRTDEGDVIDLPTRVEAVSGAGLLAWTSPVSPTAIDHLDEELVLLEVAGGQVTAIEFFDAGQLEHARRRWRSLDAKRSVPNEAGRATLPRPERRDGMKHDVGPATAEPEPAPELDWVDRDLIVFEDTVPEIVISLVEHSRDGSAAELETLLVADLAVTDLRKRTDTPMIDRDQVIRTLARFGPNVFDVRLLAVRGDGLGLVRIMFERTEGGIADMVVLVQGDADAGLIERLEIHDTALFPDAVRALSGAHFARLPADLQAVLGVTAGALGAIIARDFDALAGVLDDDFVYREHRESMPTELGRDDSIALLGSILDEMPDVIDYAPEIVAISSAGLVTTRTQSTIDRLGRTDVDVVVMGVRDGRLRAFEIFEFVHIDRAKRLLDSWS